MNNLVKLNPDAKIVESNKLLREMICKQTNKVQLDIILSVIALAPTEATKFCEYEISVSEFCKLINPSNPRKVEVKEKVIKAIEELMDCKFWLHSEGVHTCYHFVEKSVYDENEKSVSFKISDEVAKFFLDIKDTATIYALKDMMALHTIFQANVFSWCMAKCNFENEIHLRIEDAKLLFNGEKEIETKFFLVKLDDAIKTINKKTPLEISYEKIRDGKQVKELKFVITNNYCIKEIKQYSDAQLRANAKKTQNLYKKYEEIKEENEILHTIVCLQDLTEEGRSDIAQKVYDEYKETKKVQ